MRYWAFVALVVAGVGYRLILHWNDKRISILLMHHNVLSNLKVFCLHNGILFFLQRAADINNIPCHWRPNYDQKDYERISNEELLTFLVYGFSLSFSFQEESSEILTLCFICPVYILEVMDRSGSSWCFWSSRWWCQGVSSYLLWCMQSVMWFVVTLHKCLLRVDQMKIHWNLKRQILKLSWKKRKKHHHQVPCH